MSQLTIKEVAKKANVSVATISRVINNGPKVGPRTRKRVAKVIEKVGYCPNITALRLRKKTTSVIAVFIPKMSHFDHMQFGYFFYEILAGIESVIEQKPNCPGNFNT